MEFWSNSMFFPELLRGYSTNQRFVCPHGVGGNYPQLPLVTQKPFRSISSRRPHPTSSSSSTPVASLLSAASTRRRRLSRTPLLAVRRGSIPRRSSAQAGDPDADGLTSTAARPQPTASGGPARLRPLTSTSRPLGRLPVTSTLTWSWTSARCSPASSVHPWLPRLRQHNTAGLDPWPLSPFPI